MGTRCAVYLRISLDADGDELAISRQREDCERIAKERDLTIVAEFVDNSISASDKRRDRPGYNRLVEAYAAGEFDALICWDLDRLTRQPRQLEDWIDAAEERGLLLLTANGEADLSTDGGQLFARIKASVAKAEVQRKSVRQKRAALQRSEQGRPPLGVRLTGYETIRDADKRRQTVVVADEAELVREMFNRFHSGDSLRGITAWLDETDALTRRGRAWNPSSVRSILTNPRYAGRAVYQGKPNGTKGDWPALVTDAIFDVVQARLSDPRRRTQLGTDRKYLGSGLYTCGVCDSALTSHSGSRYRCPQGHIVRIAASIDAYVLSVLRERLGRADLIGLLALPDGPKARAAAGEIAGLRARLVQIEADYDNGDIDGRRFKIATEKVRVQLRKAESGQVRVLAGAGVAPIVGAADPVAAFDSAPLGSQRAVLTFFASVRLLPTLRGHKFDPTSVQVVWKRTPGA